MESQSGELQYVSDGNTEVCGLYLIGAPEQIVEIAFLDFDVKCSNGGVVAVGNFQYSVRKLKKMKNYIVLEI